MKSRKDTGPVWVDRESALVLKSVSTHTVEFVDDQDYQREQINLTFPRSVWEGLGAPITLKAGVWEGRS